MKKSLIISSLLSFALLFVSCRSRNTATGYLSIGSDIDETVTDTISINYGLSKIGTAILLPLNGMDCSLNGRMIGPDEWKDFFHEGRYTVVHFINNKKCSICLMKMIFWWDDFADELGRDNVDYCFIVHPDQVYTLDELVCELNKIYFSFPVFFDFNALFINANECFATLEMPDCILLDKDKRIVAVGNMDAPEKMYAGFKSAII